MTPQSILYESDVDRVSHGPEQAPDYFQDLHLDRIVQFLTAGYEDYDVERFFYLPLRSAGTIEYRHEVMRDLEDDRVLSIVQQFTDGMRRMHEKRRLSKQTRSHHQKQRWSLHAIESYCSAVRELGEKLTDVKPASRALRSLREYVIAYASSDAFTELQTESIELANALSDVRYVLTIRGTSVTVNRDTGAADYSAELSETFRPFVERAARDYRFEFRDEPEMNYVEARILEGVVSLYPDVFRRLDRFCEAHQEFSDPTIVRFEREIQFYLAYLELMKRLTPFGASFTYPELSDGEGSTFGEGIFDLTAAIGQTNHGADVVRNSFSLDGKERIIILSGTQRSAKASFARAFGQLYYFAALGLPVPGTHARVMLCDAMFTYFDGGEEPSEGSNRLRDELFWSRDVLRKATPRSVVILYELFGSLGLADTAVLARGIVEKIGDLGALCLYATFLDELVASSDKTVGMVCIVPGDDPAASTYEIVRGPVQGPSRAFALATRFGLTYDRIRARIPS
jgi:DNA mismatch repair protein MutS